MKSSLMVSLVSLALATAPAIAQNYTGTYTTTDQMGGTVTLVLQQDPAGLVTGTFAIGDLTFRVQASVEDGELYGAAVADAGAMYLEGVVENGEFFLLIADIGPGNQPDFTDAREISLRRTGGAGAASGGPPPQPASPQQPTQRPAPLPQPGPGGQGDQLSQLLLSSRWCSFSYSSVPDGSAGRSNTETITFQQDGIVFIQTGGESYSGGAAGSVAGQRAGGTQLYWKTSNGNLMFSADGSAWETVPLEVSYNSNGYPILKSDQTEYMQC